MKGCWFLVAIVLGIALITECTAEYSYDNEALQVRRRTHEDGPDKDDDDADRIFTEEEILRELNDVDTDNEDMLDEAKEEVKRDDDDDENEADKKQQRELLEKAYALVDAADAKQYEKDEEKNNQYYEPEYNELLRELKEMYRMKFFERMRQEKRTSKNCKEAGNKYSKRCEPTDKNLP